jgi:hypothetical protein
LILILLVAIGSIWFAAKLEKAKQQRAVVDWVLADQHGHVQYNFESGPAKNPTPPGPKWARGWLGVDFFAKVRSVVLDNQEVDDLSPLLNLPDLEFIGVFIDILPEADLQSLAQLKNLQQISIDYSDVKQTDIDMLSKALPNCKIWLGHKARVIE